MLLAIDVGNTQTVIGLFDDLADEDVGAGELKGLRHHWRVSTVVERTADEYLLLLEDLLSLVGLSLIHANKASDQDVGVDGIALSSSVPSVTAALRAMVLSRLDLRLVVVEPGVKTGMPILYDNPKEVGADRIVNAVAAIDLYDAPLIVVDLGTATTFDVISADGEYLGGAIVPGIEISMNALFVHAAALRRVELVAPPNVIGRSTVESMQAGAVLGHASLVDGMCERIAKENGVGPVVATGGLASLIAPHAQAITNVEPWLTLHGLRLIYERNAGNDLSGKQL